MQLFTFFIEDLRCDQHRWINQDVQKVPKRLPTMKKSYYRIDTPAGGLAIFTKHAYQLLINKINPLVLVHYIGDESVAVYFPHGNSKDSDSKYVRTMPSVL